jgi:predicted XRE-type DNA-binding protein
MTRRRESGYEIGTSKVFADFGLDDADELLTRTQLGHTVRLILKGGELKQRESATLLGIDQADVEPNERSNIISSPKAGYLRF